MNEYSGFSQHIAKATIELAKTGDKSAMEAIYVQYANPCFSLANRITTNPQMSEDIVHSVFVKVMKNISTFEHSGPFSGWIRRIAVNESIAILQSHNKFDSTIEFEDEQIISEYLQEANTQFDTAWWEAQNDLQKLSQRLSARARTILFLHEIEGYSHKEIAELFGKTESFSKQSLARSMRLLQTLTNIKGA
jgi:RNA polymerase sigma factor (sigma-70 family)